MTSNGMVIGYSVTHSITYPFEHYGLRVHALTAVTLRRMDGTLLQTLIVGKRVKIFKKRGNAEPYKQVETN